MAPITADDTVKFLIACITCKEGDKVRIAISSVSTLTDMNRSTSTKWPQNARSFPKPPRKCTLAKHSIIFWKFPNRISPGIYQARSPF